MKIKLSQEEIDTKLILLNGNNPFINKSEI